MRARSVLAVIAIIIITIVVKVFIVSPRHAEADIPGMNALQMHSNYPNIKNMPVQKMHDMSLVFSDND